MTAELPFLEIAARTPPLGLSVLGPHPSGRVGDSQTLRPSWDLRPPLPSTERQPEALVWRLPGQAHSGSHVPKPAQLRRASWSNNTRAACFLFSVKTETQAQRLAEQKHLFLPPGPIPRVWSRACNHQPGSQRQCSSLLGSHARGSSVCGVRFQDGLTTGCATGGRCLRLRQGLDRELGTQFLLFSPFLLQPRRNPEVASGDWVPLRF